MAVFRNSPSAAMISGTLLRIYIFALLACLSVQSRELLKHVSGVEAESTWNIKRSDFPSDFLFGAATSAAQIEGSISEDGRTPSVWDDYVVKHPERIFERGNTSISIDSYKRWEEDLKALKEIGVTAYRFSISWNRILPDGTLAGGINQEGIRHYKNIIQTLTGYGIKPAVTLFHFDYPLSLLQNGGLLNSSFVNIFRDYAEVCFKEFGDSVKIWITINEPSMVAKFGFSMGAAPPTRCTKRGFCAEGDSAREPYIASHHYILAHAAAVKLYRDKFQKTQGGEIGLSLVGPYFEPYSQSPKDMAAQERAMAFELGWYVEPLVYGKYPKAMKKYVKERLPTFTEEEKQLVKGAFDFIGINYYTARYAKNELAAPNAPPDNYDVDKRVKEEVKNEGGVDIGPAAPGSDIIYIYPQGLQKLLEFMKEKYRSPKIYITENGVSEKRNDSRPVNDALNDQFRIDFIRRHLFHAREAIKNGVNLKGYFHWSVFDSFEWEKGYFTRFGLYYIDYNNNLTRIPKASAKWYRDFITTA